MAYSTRFKCIPCIVYVSLGIIHTIGASPRLKSGPGIEIMPAAFSQDGKLNFVVVDENKGANTNNQLQSQYVPPQAQQSQVQYQQPITQQPQYQYVQPQSAPGQQPYYSYQQPQYVQLVPYPGPATYYTEPSDYPAYGPPQPSPYYPTVGPIRERGGFWSAPPGATSTRFSPFSSIRSSLPSGVSAGASLLGAALLLG